MIVSKLTHLTGRLVTPHGKVWFKRTGAGSALPVITLHGGPGFPHDYLEPLEAIGEERPIIFYDQLGCGRSDRPSDPSLWSVGYFVHELEMLRAELELPRIHLFGQSWGSIIALEYYLRFPERVASIVFASPCLSARLWEEDANRLRQRMGEEWNRVVTLHETNGTTDSVEYKAAIDAFVRQFVCRLDRCLEFERALIGMGEPVYLTMWGPAEFTLLGKLRGYDRTSERPRVRVPTLFTCGRFDEATPESVASYASAVPGSRQVVFESSAHFAHITEAERYLEVLREFFKDIN